MKRLLYISTARAVPDDAMIRSILDASRRNNAPAGVTGMLVVGGRRFLQVLEGEDGAVGTVYRRIAKDPRHSAIVVLAEQAIERRSFAEWNMGYHRADIGHGATDLPTVVAQLTATIEDPNLRAYFTSFAQLHAAA